MTTSDHQAHGLTDDCVYGTTVNASLMRLFSPGERVLDIGCGSGAWGPDLKKCGAGTLIGVEASKAAALQAGKYYDTIHCTPIEQLTLETLGNRPFDTIIAADVIEHLVAPWSELARWSSWVVPSGELVLSVPNLRYFRILSRLAIKGRFDYSDGGGLMDRTHLRWFTRKSLTDELMLAGWCPQIWASPFGRRSSRVSRLSAGWLDELLIPQIQVVCVPTANAPRPLH